MIPKPAKGSTTALRRRKAAQVKRYERAIMDQARARDGHVCRLCGDRPVDPCHMIHRGMGGNPKGDRTRLELIICLCRRHHQAYDSAQLVITCLSDAGANGPVKFQAK